MEEYRHYNCARDEGSNAFSIYLRSAYGIAIFDYADQLSQEEHRLIKEFAKKILNKKSYVVEGSRLFIEENNEFITRVKSKRLKILPVAAVPWNSFIALTSKLHKQDLLIQAMDIVERTQYLHPVISGLFIFAAMTQEALGMNNHLDDFQINFDEHFGIDIKTGSFDFNVLHQAVTEFAAERNTALNEDPSDDDEDDGELKDDSGASQAVSDNSEKEFLSGELADEADDEKSGISQTFVDNNSGTKLSFDGFSEDEEQHSTKSLIVSDSSDFSLEDSVFAEDDEEKAIPFEETILFDKESLSSLEVSRKSCSKHPSFIAMAIRNSNEQILSISSEKHDSEDQLQTLSTRFHQLLKMGAQMKSQLEEALAENATLKADKKLLQAETGVLKEANNVLLIENASLKEDKKLLEAETDGLKEARRKLEGETDSLKDDKKTLQAEIDLLKKTGLELQESKGDIIELQSQILSQNETISSLKKSNLTLQSKLNDMTQNEKDYLALFSGQVKKLEAERNALRAEKEHLYVEKVATVADSIIIPQENVKDPVKTEEATSATEAEETPSHEPKHPPTRKVPFERALIIQTNPVDLRKPTKPRQPKKDGR